MRILCMVGLCVALAYGQNTKRTFTLAAADTPQNVKEMVNAIRVITQIEPIYTQLDARTITVSGRSTWRHGS